MQRKDVERLARTCEHQANWSAAAPELERAAQMLRDLLDRAERAEATAEALREAGLIWAQRVGELEAERGELDAIASKLQHDHDMMALANGKLEAERDAAFAAGQEETAAYFENRASAAEWVAGRISELPIKTRP